MTSDIKYTNKADALPNGDKQVFAVKPMCLVHVGEDREDVSCAVDMVQSLANDTGMKFIDCLSGYMETMAITEITLDYGWEGDDDSDESNDVEWLTISGKVFFLKNISKDHGGWWNAADRQWYSINIAALPKLLQKCYDFGMPITGNFNWDGCSTAFLGSHGGYIVDDKIKWQLHQVVTSTED
eukprot:1250573-Rhodomonas_salina.2